MSNDKKQLNSQPVEKLKEEIASEERMRILAKAIFAAIQKADEEVKGSFTAYEMNAVFLKMAHRYNQHGLTVQYKKQ